MIEEEPKRYMTLRRKDNTTQLLGLVFNHTVSPYNKRAHAPRNGPRPVGQGGVQWRSAWGCLTAVSDFAYLPICRPIG